jgi:molecular chaperone DnaK
MKLHLGIDLGTSNSAVAALHEGRAVVYKTAEGTDVMPSVIYRDRRGNQTVGVRAYDQATMAPENVVQGFKRMMGTKTPSRFTSTGQEISPEEASAEVLRALVSQALVEAGADAVAGAVITIPAAFNQMQIEATLAAARTAGLDRVALLQEPVAAALAAMANARERSGVFLVYDLGGGTFDAALVQAVDGAVTVLAHEGINMLGGRDFDRVIVDNVVQPWLLQTFDLPAGYQADRRYGRLVRVARRAAEDAKIALTTRDRATVSASDEIVRLEDASGEPIYIDVPLERSFFNKLIGDKLEPSFELCRKIIADTGFQHEDVQRVVLIGGPTKMPALRRAIQDALGIAVEDVSRVDPMTAVAIGAAIYCEGRDWTAEVSTAKATRASEAATEAGLSVTYDFEARTAGMRARLTIRKAAGPEGATVQVESLLGWSSGRRPLAAPVVLDLDLPDLGPNRFRALVFDPHGRPVAGASKEIVVERLLAASSGIPASQTIAVKIVDDAGKNLLEELIPKGTELPAQGTKVFRAATTLRAGSEGVLRLELFQMNSDQVRSPDLNLSIGDFRIAASDLPEGMSVRQGDAIIVHWQMSDSQTVSADVEVPSVGQRFDQRNFYDYQVTAEAFDGSEGGRLVQLVVALAYAELERAEDSVPSSSADALRALRHDLDRKAGAAEGTTEAEVRREVAEAVRLIRQSIAAVTAHPDARAAVLRRRLDEEVRWYNSDVRPSASSSDSDRVDTLAKHARQQLDTGSRSALDLTERMIDEIDGLYWRVGLGLHSFCVDLWRSARENRHLARDRVLFDRIVAEGDRALGPGDLPRLRDAIFRLFDNAMQPGAQQHVSKRASLMRH